MTQHFGGNLPPIYLVTCNHKLQNKTLVII
jgi:hypothetical protein